MDQEHLVKCSISFKYILWLCFLFAFLRHFLNCNSQNLLFQLWDRIKLLTKICKAFVFFLLTIRHWNVHHKVPVHHHSALCDIMVSQAPWLREQAGVQMGCMVRPSIASWWLRELEALGWAKLVVKDPLRSRLTQKRPGRSWRWYWSNRSMASRTVELPP